MNAGDVGSHAVYPRASKVARSPPTGTPYDFDAALTAWNHAFAPAINRYLRDGLGWDTDLQYWVFGPVHPWKRSGDDTGENLRLAVAQNPPTSTSGTSSPGRRGIRAFRPATD